MAADTASAERLLLTSALQRVAAGDRSAFQEVYRRTAAKLFGVCLRIFSDRNEAEDVLQEVYLVIWQKAGQFDPARASPITWLVALTRNRAIDRLRSTGKTITTPIDAISEPADDTASVLDTMIEVQDEHRIGECLDELDRGDAVLIRTAFFQQTTYADLAARANMPLGTIKSRIRRALIKLRVCLT